MVSQLLPAFALTQNFRDGLILEKLWRSVLFKLQSTPANAVIVLSPPNRSNSLTLKPAPNLVGCVWRTAPPGFDSQTPCVLSLQQSTPLIDALAFLRRKSVHSLCLTMWSGTSPLTEEIVWELPSRALGK